MIRNNESQTNGWLCSGNSQYVQRKNLPKEVIKKNRTIDKVYINSQQQNLYGQQNQKNTPPIKQNPKNSNKKDKNWNKKEYVYIKQHFIKGNYLI